jgi:hypothetical protein
MADPKTLLTLDTDTPRDVVRIDGHDYPLADMDDFSLKDQHRLSTTGKRVMALSDKPDATEAEIADAQSGMDSIFTRILPLPDDVATRVKFGARMRIIAAFFNARGEPSAPENGPTSSPASSASTAAIPERG